MSGAKGKYLAVLAIALTAGAAMGDGMIVPVRPDIRIRGSWAVKYHHVSIKVRNQVASVSIDQQFVNTGSGMIEVEYLFPVPPGAAIDSMTLVVDGKEFAAKLLEADEARKIYESIVRSKKDPALLEYVGFGLYKTRAFPLRPGKPCRVLVTYKNVCKKDWDVVEVWYPLNTEKFSAKAIESVEVKVDIKSQADIGAVYSPTHDLSVDRKDPRHVVATYKAVKTLPISDFQVFYKSSNDKVGATLLTHQAQADKDGYFMLLVTPGLRGGRAAVVAKDVVMVLDHSGSMGGDKIEQARDALSQILKNLNSGDRFNVVSYSDSIDTFFPSLVPANKENVSAALGMVDSIEARGGTNIHGALRKAVSCFEASGPDEQKDTGRPKYVMFLTDGLATVGEKTDVPGILADTKAANTSRARIFTFGVGYKPNVRLMDKLAGQSGGRSEYVKPTEPIEAKISSLYNKIKNPVMTSLKLSIQGVTLRDMYPRDLGDLFDGDQIVVMGRYDFKSVSKLPAGEGKARRATLIIKGLYQGEQRAFEYKVNIRPAGKDLRFAFVEKIWAIRRVGFLLDQIQLHGKSSEVIDELVSLSKQYGIMTPYTSFLADERTVLSKRAEVMTRAMGKAKSLGKSVSGEAAQRGAVTRSRLNYAAKAGQSAMAPALSDAGGMSLTRDSVALYGHGDRDSYESEKLQYVAGVRQVGNYALYRRGRVWMTAEASKLDLEKDADTITTITRFSTEYFNLTRLNSLVENQIMASQLDNEELVIQLRNKYYRVK